jgi:glutathionylspermidine synthase
VRRMTVKSIPYSIFDELGFYWYSMPENPHYVADELVIISEEEGEAYYEAAGELYDMFIEAGQYVIDHKLYHLLDIPGNLHEMIEHTWEDERHFHIVGRFDFAGGLDGKPIKLIEFNADTPSVVFEIALVQWMILKHNGLEEERQFNSLYEALKESFLKAKRLHPSFAGNPDAVPSALFSCIESTIEDENTTRLYEMIAYECGFATDFAYVHDVFFSPGEGVQKGSGDKYRSFDYWFKLIPYEYIAYDEPELAEILTDIVKAERSVILNPPYALLFQSKGLLKILWDMFPGHPLLLDTGFEPLWGKPCAEKRTLGREGANIRILDAGGKVQGSTDGGYERFRPIYQEYVDFPQDEEGRLYQAGVFFSSEPCGLGFRRDMGIMQDHSQFIGHYIGDTP